MVSERVLSVFCDESGDFGPLAAHSPYYLITLVFHDQNIDIMPAVSHLETALAQEGRDKHLMVHAGPLIRREPPYFTWDGADRMRLFTHLERFARHCDIQTKTFVIKKKEHGSGDHLSERLAREAGAFIRDNLSYFHAFDRVIVYYDRGQKQISNVLRIIFSSNISQVEFRTVDPVDYRLFQVADLVCTMRLLDRKLADGTLSASEIGFFGNRRKLKKNHLKLLDKLERR